MNALATGESMSKKIITFQIKCDKAWLERVKTAADAVELSAAAYIRQATSLKMDADGIPRPKPRKPN